MSKFVNARVSGVMQDAAFISFVFLPTCHNYDAQESVKRICRRFGFSVEIVSITPMAQYDVFNPTSQTLTEMFAEQCA